MTDQAASRPNLLFLMTDHQRADSLGMVQAGIEVCPTLNRLAAQGSHFTRAYNTCPLCVPARTALATGKYPTSNGVVFNDWRGLRAGDHLTLHERLAQAGYSVAHVGIDHIRVRPHIRERLGFSHWIGAAEHAERVAQQGIHETREQMAPFQRAITENQNGQRVDVRYSNTRTAVWPHDARHFKDSFWCDAAADLLRAGQARSFAIFVYLWAPHPPLRVPEPYASMFDPERLDLPANVGIAADGEPPGRRLGISAQLAEDIGLDDWRKVWAAHVGLVRLADDGLARVLQALDDTGEADNTIVLFTVDHGDQLGQHRMYQKMEMYGPAVRVPLIVRMPDAPPHTCDAPVSHLDVVPTLLDLLGLAAPDDLDGISLARNVRTGAPAPERPVFCQYSGNPTVGDIRRAVITRRHKYVYDPADAPELYDLEADPLEMTNLAADSSQRETLDGLHATCAAWAKDHGDWVAF